MKKILGLVLSVLAFGANAQSLANKVDPTGQYQITYTRVANGDAEARITKLNGSFNCKIECNVKFDFGSNLNWDDKLNHKGNVLISTEPEEGFRKLLASQPELRLTIEGEPKQIYFRLRG